jgi:ribonuclease HI
MTKKILIYTDGGSRGNPGPAASGYVVNGKSYGVYLGRATNNVAEYSAIKFALEQASKEAGEHAWETAVEIRMDSQLAQRQLIGRYKMKNAGLRPIFDEIQKLAKHFKQVSYVHIPREENSTADAAVNKALDQQRGVI